MTMKLSTINQFNRDNNLLKKDIITSFQKASSLNAYDSFQQLASLGYAEKVSAMETNIATQEMFGELARDAGQTINFIDNKLDELQQISTGHLSSMVTLQSSAGKSINYDVLAKNFLSSLASILNSQLDNKYVFSGDDYLTVPVVGIVSQSNLIDGIPTNNYYQGSQTKLSVILNDLNSKIVYGINADNEAFQNLIAGIYLSIAANQGSNIDNGLINQGYDLFYDGVKKIIEVRSKLGNDWSSVTQAESTLSNEKSFWKDEKNKISGVDIVDSQRKLKEDLAALESSYTALNKVNSVKILDYI